MTDRIAALARRVESDKQFLASALADYAHAENLDDQALAQRLGCPTNILVPLRLCLRPGPEPVVFRREVDRIATRFGVDARVLAEGIRLSDALGEIRDKTGMEEGGLLMAARDRQRSRREKLVSTPMWVGETAEKFWTAAGELEPFPTRIIHEVEFR